MNLRHYRRKREKNQTVPEWKGQRPNSSGRYTKRKKSPKSRIYISTEQE